jgi:hypothetical protein
MEFPDIPEVQVGSSGSCNGGDCLREVSPFTYGVNNNHDSIIPSRFWEFRDEVHTNGVPAIFRDRERLKFANGRTSLSFSAKARVTMGDILTHIPRHVWPPVVPGDKFQSLESSGMPGYLGVMAE